MTGFNRLGGVLANSQAIGPIEYAVDTGLVLLRHVGLDSDRR